MFLIYINPPAPPPPPPLFASTPLPPFPPPPIINISYNIPPDGALIVYCVCPVPAPAVSVVYVNIIFISFPNSLGNVTVSDIGVL